MYFQKSGLEFWFSSQSLVQKQTFLNFSFVRTANENLFFHYLFNVLIICYIEQIQFDNNIKRISLFYESFTYTHGSTSLQHQAKATAICHRNPPTHFHTLLARLLGKEREGGGPRWDGVFLSIPLSHIITRTLLRFPPTPFPSSPAQQIHARDALKQT